MTDFVLPNQTTLDAVDQSSFTINDSDSGFCTKEVGTIIKMMVDQMPNTELVHIRSPRTATGKTEKFILDNVASAENMPKIVTSDFFGNTLLDCTNFFTYTGNNAKIFKNTFKAPVINTDENGDVTSIVVGQAQGEDVTYTLTEEPPARSSSQLASLSGFDDAFDMSVMVNSSGTALGTSEDDFAPELVVCMLNPIETPNPNWDQHAMITILAVTFNNLPVNGAMIVNHIEYDRINQALWSVLNAQTSAGRTYNISWVSSEGADQVLDVAIIKRLS